MEKLMYLAWKKPEQSTADFSDALRNSMSSELTESGVRQLSIAISDEAVAPAHNLRQMSMAALPDAIVSVWLDSHIRRDQQQAIIERYTQQCSGYLVTESVPIVNRQQPTLSGERSLGMNQVALLKKPEHLSRNDWLDIWHNSHTQVAIDTQSTFGYRQNVVVLTLTQGAFELDAIVEEMFPDKAMSCAHTFFDAYDAQGEKDDQLLTQRGEIMLNSCSRFIDFEQLNVIPMSEYFYQ